MPKINKLSHVVFFVSDVERSKVFYRDILGMELISDRPEDGPSAFLSFGTQHHDIALFQAPPGATRGELGLFHAAFQVDGGDEELRAIRQHVIDAGVEIERQQFHGITKSVYFRDPDGTLIEFYTEQMSSEDGLKYMRAQTGLGVSDPLEI
jgi:catechol 2,3-dioxygenase